MNFVRDKGNGAIEFANRGYDHTTLITRWLPTGKEANGLFKYLQLVRCSQRTGLADEERVGIVRSGGRTLQPPCQQESISTSS